MNVLDLFVNSYALLKNYGMPYFIMTPLRRVVRKLSNNYLPKYLSKPTKLSDNRCKGLIVSLTSFPARINHVWQVIECMKRQTLLPERIILWLSNEQFPTKESLPKNLRDREDELFSIRLVDGDIRSHKKYYYISKENPYDLIFLIDDDIYYDTDIINRSLREYRNYGDRCVICNYGYQIKFDKNGCLPYSQWQAINGKAVGKNIFFGSGGGTLFRPIDLYQDLINIDIAMKLTPIADDVWLNTMALKTGLTKIILPNGPLLTIDIEDNVTLSSINNGHSKNDEQILAIKQYYRDVFNYPL